MDMKYIKSIQTFFTAVLLMVAVLLPQVAWADYNPVKPANGNGSEDNPFQLTRPEEMVWFRHWVNGTYTPNDGETASPHPSACAKLVNSFAVPAGGFVPIGNTDVKYSGTFDGNGMSLWATYSVTGKEYVGIFGYTDGATIKNISVSVSASSSVTGAYVGAVVGRADNSLLQNITKSDCYMSGSKSPKYVGGFVGYAQNTDIIDCESVTYTSYYYSELYNYLGGICGYFNGGNIKRCSVRTDYGSMSPIKGGDFVGGIVGYLAAGTISDCANFVDVEGKDYVGGLVGFWDHGTLENVLSCASVSATPTYSSYNYFGIFAGFIIAQSTGGVIAYSENCTLKRDGVPVDISDNTYYDYYYFRNNAISFSTTQLASGEATYILNGSTSTPAAGTSLAWYQKLGDNGDSHPVLKSTGDNTVYVANNVFKCDGKTPLSGTLAYQNEHTNKYVQPHQYKEYRVDSYANLYLQKCSVCSTLKDNKRTLKNFCGKAGNNLELTYEDNKYKAETVTLTDGEAYNSPVDIEVADFKYARTYAANQWQPLYVPFAIDVEQWTENGFTVACINNFHETKLSSGETQVLLEVKKVTGGTLQPNEPYLIAYDTEGESTQELGSTTLVTAQENYIDCRSVTRNYWFRGKYSALKGFSADAASVLCYAIEGGEMVQLGTESEVKPQSWYLAITKRSNLYGDDTPLTVAGKNIRIKMVGEGTATGIEDIHVVCDEGHAGQTGIFDLQGRRLQAEPAHGIYIKDGKKLVK